MNIDIINTADSISTQTFSLTSREKSDIETLLNKIYKVDTVEEELNTTKNTLEEKINAVKSGLKEEINTTKNTLENKITNLDNNTVKKDEINNIIYQYLIEHHIIPESESDPYT